MSWYKKSQQQYLWGDDPQLPSANANTIIEYWDLRFPKAGEIVSGLNMTDNIDNTSSIEASMTNYHVYPGVREIPMSEFGSGGYAAVNDNMRSERLAEEIKISKQINPLIVVIDKEGPYVLEGGHRLQALQILEIKSFPALVVLDLDDEVL